MSSGWFSSGGWGHYALASPVHTYIAEPNNFSPICLKFSKPQPPRPLSVFSNWCHVYRDHPLACHISVNVSSYRQNCSSLECWLRNVMICPQVHIPSMQRFFRRSEMESPSLEASGALLGPPGVTPMSAPFWAILHLHLLKMCLMQLLGYPCLRQTEPGFIHSYLVCSWDGSGWLNISFVTCLGPLLCYIPVCQHWLTRTQYIHPSIICTYSMYAA